MTDTTDFNFENEPDINELRSAHEGLRKGDRSALRRLEVLVESGSVMAALYIARYFLRSKPPMAEKATYWYERASALGSVYATYRIAMNLVGKNRYKEAVPVLEKCVAVDYAPAMAPLGRLYFEGLGVKQNRMLGRDLVERGVAHGQIFAKRYLGIINLVHGENMRMRVGGLKSLIGLLNEVFVVFRNEGEASRKLR